MYIKEELTGIECDNCKDQYRAKHTDFSFFTDEGNAYNRQYGKRKHDAFLR